MLSWNQFAHDPKGQDFTAKDEHDPHSYTPNPHFRNVDRGQGRLFAEQQYPRGYGPQRQQNVNRALGIGDETSIASRRADILGYEHTPLARTVTDEIKRSTIPAAHLAQASPQFYPLPPGGTSAGTYVTKTGAKAFDSGLVEQGVQHGLELQHVVAHEMGHEQAHRIMGKPAVDYLNTGVGVVEAHADAYAYHHQRLKGGTPQGYSATALLGQSAHIASAMEKHGYESRSPESEVIGYYHTLATHGAQAHPSLDAVKKPYEEAMAAKNREPGTQMRLPVTAPIDREGLLNRASARKKMQALSPLHQAQAKNALRRNKYA